MDMQSFTPSSELTGEIANPVRQILRLLGEDPEREGLLKTPQRVGEAYQFLCKGYAEDAVAILRSALFHEDSKQMVLVKDIEFYSLCEHHLLPFFGKVHVAYIPDGTITGLSKLARIVDVYAHRLQVQERMSHEILDSINTALSPMGAMVVVEAQHLCMQMRGIQKTGAVTTTMQYSGAFNQPELREEFLQQIRL